METYQFGKTLFKNKPNNKLKFYCKVAYSRKNKAKKYGGKWDEFHKLWYFEYEAEEYEKNRYLNTNEFKPVFVELIGYVECVYNEESILNEGLRRYREYVASTIREYRVGEENLKLFNI
jgi:hypothetical protein